MTRIWIGGPTLAAVPASFALDLAQLYAYTQPRVAAVLGFIQSAYIHVGREAVLKAAIGYDATHILWIDTDMMFPPETAMRLLAHEKDIVAANCVMKHPTPIFTAVRDSQRIETGPDSTGLETVDTVGCAVMLMRMAVVASLPRPIFTHGLNDDGSDVGEDLMFCRAARRAGFDIFVDHDLSKEIGHVGQHTYRISSRAPVTV